MQATAAPSQVHAWYERIGTKQITLIFAAVILFVLVAFPLLELIVRSFAVNGKPSLANYITVLSERRNFLPFVNTFILGGLTVIGSLLIGVPGAWLVTRTDMPFKRLAETMFLLPYMIPPFIGAMAWIQLLSPRIGYVNRIWAYVTGAAAGPFNIYSIAGLTWVMVLHGFPFVFLTVRGALERMDPTLEEAAIISGASRFRVMRDITLRLAMPAISAGALLIFVDTIANFGIPALIGMRARFFVLTTQIFTYVYTGDFEGIKLAAALSSLLMFLAGGGVILNDLYLRRRSYAVIAGKSARPNTVALGRWRKPVVVGLAVFFLVIIVAPFTSIFLSALLKAWGLPIAWKNLTLANFHYILFEYDLTQRAMANSLFLAVSAATVASILGGVAAYISVKTRVRGRQVIDVLATLPHAIPGTVVALAMILAWSGSYGINLYNTIWIILVAYVARYVFFTFRNAAASLGQIHVSLEEAAMMCGADWIRNFWDIVIPLIKPGLLAGWFLVFMPCLRELTISILLWGPDTPTIGVAVFEMQDAGYYTSAAAMASLLLAVVLVGDFVLRRFTGARFS